MGIGRDGVSAKSILDTAEQLRPRRPRHQGRRLADQAAQARARSCTGSSTTSSCSITSSRTACGSSIRRPARATCRSTSSRRRSPASRSSSRRRRASRRRRPRRAGSKRYVDELLAEKGLFSRVIVVSLFLRLVALALPLMTGMIIDRVVPRSDYDLLYVCLATIGGMVAFRPVAEVVRAHLLLAPAHRARHADDARLPRPHGLAAVLVLPAPLDRRPHDARRLERHGPRDRDQQVAVGGDRRPVRAALRGRHLLRQPDARPHHDRDVGSPRRSCSCCARADVPRLLAADLDKQAKAHSYMVQMLGGMETLKCAGAERLGLEKWATSTPTSSTSACSAARVERVRRRASAARSRRLGADADPHHRRDRGHERQAVARHDARDELARDRACSARCRRWSAARSSSSSSEPHGPHRRRAADAREQDRDKVGSRRASRGHVTRQEPVVQVRRAGPAGRPGRQPRHPARHRRSRSSARRARASRRCSTCSPASTSRRTATSSTTASRSHELDLRAVRQQIGVVPQHPFIFGGTMRENVALAAPGATLDRIQRAAKVAVPPRRHHRDADGLRHRDLRRRRLALGRPAPARRASPAPSSATRR